MEPTIIVAGAVGAVIGAVLLLVLLALVAPEPIVAGEDEAEVRLAVRDALVTGTGVVTLTTGSRLVRLDPRTYAIRVVE